MSVGLSGPRSVGIGRYYEHRRAFARYAVTVHMMGVGFYGRIISLLRLSFAIVTAGSGRNGRWC